MLVGKRTLRHFIASDRGRTFEAATETETRPPIRFLHRREGQAEQLRHCALRALDAISESVAQDHYLPLPIGQLRHQRPNTRRYPKGVSLRIRHTLDLIRCQALDAHDLNLL
jgi:hypothetical protein